MGFAIGSATTALHSHNAAAATLIDVENMVRCWRRTGEGGGVVGGVLRTLK